MFRECRGTWVLLIATYRGDEGRVRCEFRGRESSRIISDKISWRVTSAVLDINGSWYLCERNESSKRKKIDVVAGKADVCIANYCVNVLWRSKGYKIIYTLLRKYTDRRIITLAAITRHYRCVKFMHFYYWHAPAISRIAYLGWL